MGLSESKSDKEKEIEFLRQTGKVESDGTCSNEDKINFSAISLHLTDNVYVYCDLCYPACHFIVADKLCKTCNRYLCKSCFVSHRHVLFKDTHHEIRITESVNVVRNETQPISLEQSNVEKAHASRDVLVGDELKVTNDVPKYVREINTTGCNDTDECWISGIAILKPGEIVVTDGNNCSVKVINVNNNSDITTEIGLSSEPYDVTVVSKYEIGVTLTEEQTVQYLGTLKGLSKTRRMRVNGHCFGIAHINNLTAISFLCPEKVEIINTEGKILNRFEIDFRGKELFSAPFYVVFCSEGKSVYVSDHRRDSVMKFSLDGYHAATYRAGDLDRPEGVAVMKDGSVVVASRDTNSLHIISSNCVKQKVLKGSKRCNGSSIIRPWSVCYCCEDKWLYVGNDEGQYVTVYDLS